MLAADFEVGQFLREKVVPKAVLFFTGEALDEDDSDDEDEDEDDGSDEEADPDYNPANANPQECKE